MLNSIFFQFEIQISVKSLKDQQVHFNLGYFSSYEFPVIVKLSTLNNSMVFIFVGLTAKYMHTYVYTYIYMCMSVCISAIRWYIRAQAPNFIQKAG